jgi:hypothetical protein
MHKGKQTKKIIAIRSKASQGMKAMVSGSATMIYMVSSAIKGHNNTQIPPQIQATRL